MFDRRLRFWLAIAIIAAMFTGRVAALAQTPTPPARPGLSLSVSPPKAELILSPGEEATAKATVINLSADTALIRASVWDFHVVDTSGTVQLDVPDPANQQGLGSYITLLSRDTFSLAPDAKQELSYRIRIPSDLPGGSLFGAIVFSSGPPQGTGGVTIVSEVASLIVVRVSGVGLSTLPTSRSEVVLTLPVKGEDGRKIVELKDPVTGLEVTTQQGITKVSLPVKDFDEVRQGTLTAETRAGVICTGDSAVATADRLLVQSDVWRVDVAAGGSKAGMAQVQLSFELKTLPAGSAVHVIVSSKADDKMQAAISAVAGSVPVRDVAYVIEVQKLNLEDLRHVVNAVVTLGVSRSWADQYGAPLVRLVRYGDDGSVQVLDTEFTGYDGDYAIFQAKSPDGLSTFGLVAFERPVEPAILAAGSLPPPSVTELTGAPGQFSLVLSMDVRMSGQAQAIDDQGRQVEVVEGANILLRTNVVPPAAEDVVVKLARTVQSGKLLWSNAPGVALAGSNILTLRFENTGDVDYEAQPGLATVVEMGGKVAVNMQVPKFNSFPGWGRDVTVDWVTPSSAFGRYTISAQVAFGDPLQVAYAEPVTVWVLPWKWLLSIVLSIGGLLGIGFVVMRSVREYIDRQVRKRVIQANGAPPEAESAGLPPVQPVPPAGTEPARGREDGPGDA